MVSGRIESCFLTGLDSTQVLVHALRVHDPLTREDDEVFISDMAYKMVCQEDDQEVARMWSAFKQAISSGYSDSGFLSVLSMSFDTQGYDLYKGEIDCELYLLGVSRSTIMADTSYRLMWRISKPLLMKKKLKMISENAKSIDWIDCRFKPWFDNATVISDKGNLSYDVIKNLIGFAKMQPGSQNPFDVVIQSESLAGGELMRRLFG